MKNDKYYSEIKGIFNQKFFAFNIWDFNSAKAVIDASVSKNRATFLQISSKVFNALDKEPFIYAIRQYEKVIGTKVIVHLDHARDINQIKEAVSLGWDSIMYDGSYLSIKENIRITNELSDLYKPKGILIEAEIGQVKGVEDYNEVENVNLVDINDVGHFIKSTNIDMLAVAIGTAHGQYGDKKPIIDYDLIRRVGEITNIPFVVHGGSELPNEVLYRLFSYYNVKKINISTDVKQAFRKGIMLAFDEGLLEEDGFDATKVNNKINESVKSLVLSKLEVLEETYQ
jgi:fructose-bisphosphate aldolase class II/tagatose 1,6-diphosphate aldolase GatY/KbaY